MSNQPRFVSFAICTGLASMTLCVVAAGQEQIWKIAGDPSHGVGGQFAIVGDVTGDGIADIASTYGADVIVRSGTDGSSVYSVQAPNFADGFGTSIAGLGDVDGDGIGDFAVAAPLETNLLTNQGAVFAYSGASGTAIYTVYGSLSGETLGRQIAALGDVDEDGVCDLVARTGLNQAIVLSSVDRSAIWTLNGPLTASEFGWSVGGGGDVDGDGVPDVLVGDQGSSAGARFGGAASAFSGATGTLLYEFKSSTKKARFGAALSIPGDVDHDGFDDILIGAPADDRSGGFGYAVIYSGKDGSSLMSFVPEDPPGLNTSRLWGLGSAVCGAGDVNDDGYLDVLLGAPSYGDFGGNGGAILYSTRDGSALFHFQDLASTSPGPCFFGSAVAAAGDLDGDGRTDFVFSSPHEEDSSFITIGSVSAWRGHPLYVDARPNFVYSGFQETLFIGQYIAGNPYALFLTGANGVPFFTLMAFGTLDTAGRATVNGTIPNNFGPNTLDFQAFTSDANGRLVRSGVETVFTK